MKNKLLNALVCVAAFGMLQNALAANFTYKKNISGLGSSWTATDPDAPPNTGGSGQLEISATEVPFENGSVMIGATAMASIEVYNPGPDTPLTVSASGDFTAETSCPDSLPAEDFCYINIYFSPTASGQRTGTLVLTSSFESISIPLAGSGRSPLYVQIPPDFEDSYGNTPLLNQSSHDMIIENDLAEVPLTITSITSSNAAFSVAPNPYASVGCAAGVTLSGSSYYCNLIVSFTPQSVGPQSGIITINSNKGSVTVPVSANGISGLISSYIDPQNYSLRTVDFGSMSVGDTAVNVKTIYISSYFSSANYTIQSVSSLSGDFTYVSNGCYVGKVLTPGGLCAIQIRMNPLTAGSKTASVVVQSTGGTETFTLQGEGVDPPNQGGPW